MFVRVAGFLRALKTFGPAFGIVFSFVRLKMARRRLGPFQTGGRRTKTPANANGRRRRRRRWSSGKPAGGLALSCFAKKQMAAAAAAAGEHEQRKTNDSVQFGSFIFTAIALAFALALSTTLALAVRARSGPPLQPAGWPQSAAATSGCSHRPPRLQMNSNLSARLSRSRPLKRRDWNKKKPTHN